MSFSRSPSSEALKAAAPRVPANADVFALTREQLDDLPFGVVTLDRSGKILRYNQAEAELASRSAADTIGLDFFADVAPCTNVKAFRGRFDVFAEGSESGVECFDFTFAFQWGRHDVSITMLRKARHAEINILVRGQFVESPRRDVSPVVEALPPAPPGDDAQPCAVVMLPPPVQLRLGSAEEAVLRAQIHADDIAAVRRALAGAQTDRGSYAIEYRVVRPDRSIDFVFETGAFDAPGGTAPHAVIVDITARRQREEEEIRAATHDELTGLPNRQFFTHKVRSALAAVGTTGLLTGVLILNIDKFRAVNDAFGHLVGDLLLKKVGQRLGDCIRTGDSAAYLGLDNFGILLPAVDDEEFITLIATRLLSAIAQPFIINSETHYITAHIGVNAAASHDTSAQRLIRGAYTAMGDAKRGGGDRQSWFSPAMWVDAAETGRRRDELRRAFEDEEFTLHYQPLVDTSENRVVAVESLVRWNHRTRGLVPPAAFIQLADESGMIVQLGEWILREACRQGREWADLGIDVRICVNVSASQFRQRGFVALVNSIIDASGIDPSRLELELTESIMVDGFANMVERLGKLKTLGVRLAIDDFGTGYSSLAYLKYFPVDTLKIDRAFVKDIAGDTFDQAIVKSVLTLANELHLDCVIEGIEDVEQRDMLRSIGCTIMQGYLFGRPLPPEHLTAALTRGAVPASTTPP